MERAAGFAHDDTAEAKLDKLDALLAQSFTPRQDAALIAEMLSLPNDGRYPTLELAAQQRRQKTLEALTAQLEALSRSNPVLMIFEDVHWIDPTSLEALGRSVDTNKNSRRLTDCYVPTGVRAAVDWPTSRDCTHHQPAWRLGNRRHDRPRHGQQAAAREHQAGHYRAHRWHPTVRGGNDEGGVGSREPRRRAADSCRNSALCPSGACKPARIFDGAA